jgi:tetratricopeptide (TPR) repeat protein
VAAVALIAYPFFRNSQPDTATADVFVNMSLEFYNAGQYQQSIDAAREALKRNPKSPFAYNNIAAAYGKLNRWDEAIQNAQKALKFKPDFETAQNNLAWFLKAKQPGAATPAIPKAAADLIDLSLRHYQAGRYQECMDTAREALKVKPDYPEGYNNIAAAYIALGNWDEAIKNAQEALRYNPGFVVARNNLNHALERKAAAAAAKK